MVEVLHQHIEDTNKVSRSGAELTPEKIAAPPSGAKPSSLTMFNRQTTRFREDTDTKVGQLPQLYGEKHFGRDLTEKELEIQSKFDHFPDDPHYLEKDLHIEGVTSHDVVWDERRRSQVKSKMNMMLAMHHGIKPEHVLEKLNKQRNLAEHLLNYSMQCSEEQPTLNIGSIGTFFSVGETEDKCTASLTMIALSNITSLKYVRDMMAEMNCMHKFSGIVALLHGPTSNYAASLLFYYLSLCQELEDRVFQVGNSLIANHASNSEDKHLRNVSLFTLMNLLPCLERLRVSEILCRTMTTYLQEHRECLLRDEPDEDFADDMVSIFLPIVRGNVSFSNTHATLISHDMQDMVSAAAAYAIKFNHVEMARICSEIFLALFVTRDSPPVQQLVTEAAFTDIIANLLEFKDAYVLRYTIRAVTLLSGIPTLVTFVSEADVLGMVTTVVDTWTSLESEVVSDLAKFLSNICHAAGDKVAMRSLVTEDKLHVAIMQLMDSNFSGDNMPAKRDLCKALQNLLTVSDNCKELTSQVLDTLLTITETATDIAAATSIFNISCETECIADLMKSQVHFGLQHFYANTADLEARDIFLSTILQLYRVDQCIVELYHNNIVETLHSSITGHDTQSLWPNVIRIILYQVNCSDIEFTEKEMQMVIDLLNIMCHEDTADDIIGKAAVVLAYLSLTLEEVSTVAHLLSSLLDLSDNEVVEESVSVILYNFSCIDKGVDLLLSSESYIHMMIKLMRNGAADVKQNIAKTLRTLCTREKCLELLMALPPPPKPDPFGRGPPVERGNAPLADFIVIALLRASSDSAKVMCTQAFYNMLIHPNTRGELLEGELWWAITRLSKTDDEEILETTARALLDLTSEEQTCVALRDHHVITFVQEIIRDHSEAFMKACMRSVKNFSKAVTTPYNRHELASLITISLVIIEQSKDEDTLFLAFNALLLASSQSTAASVQDFVDQHTVDILFKAIPAWKEHEGCCTAAAHLMWQLSRHDSWVAQCPLKGTTDNAVPPIDDVLETCYHHEPAASDPMDRYVDILGTALNYQKRGAVTADALQDSKVFEKCIYDTLRSRKEYPENQTCVADQEAHSVTLLAFLLDSWCDSETSAVRIRGEGLINCIVHEHFFDDKGARNNIMMIVLELTQRAKFAHLLLDANFFNVLYRDVSNFTTGLDKQLVYCSTCLRNMALHKDLVPRLLTEVENLDKLVSFLVDSNPPKEVYVDVITFFYHAASYKFENDFIINSRFSLDTIDKINKATSDENVIAVGKYVIAKILEKYSKGVSVDPAFVQSMFVEITHGNATQVEHFIDGTLFKDLGMTLANGELTVLHERSTRDPTWAYYKWETNDDEWKPYLHQVRIPMATTLLDRSAGQPLPHTAYIDSDFLQLEQHSKIVAKYDHVANPDESEWEGHEDHLLQAHLEASEEEKNGGAPEMK